MRGEIKYNIDRVCERRLAKNACESVELALMEQDSSIFTTKVTMTLITGECRAGHEENDSLVGLDKFWWGGITE